MTTNSSKIQSILIDTSKFTLKKAYDWVTTHGFKHNKIDIKDRYYRFRQFNPERGSGRNRSSTKSNKQYRTIDLTNGVKAILEF